MDLLVAWLAFPLVFGALAVGSGLLVEYGAGYRLPGALVPAVGFTLIVGISQTLTRSGAVAPVAPFAVLAAGVAGLWLGRRRFAGIDRVAVGLGLAIFVIFAAPSVLSGHVTLLGYGNQGDAGFHLLLIDRIIGHGYDLSDLIPSSASKTLQSYFDSAYPTGSHTALGAVKVLIGDDELWLLQPYIVLLVTFSAVGLYASLAPYTKAKRLAALVCGLSVSAGLVYSYADNQQALKETAALVCIVAAVGTLVPLLANPPSWRSGLPVAVATAGGLGVLSLALAPWIGPLLLVGIAVHARRYSHRKLAVAQEVVGYAIPAIVLGITALTRLGSFASTANVALTGPGEFGNLLRPLQFEQAFGIWPANDFRLPLPPGLDVVPMLIGAVALGALFGFVAAIRREAWPIVGFAVVSVIGFVAIAGRASPWAYGKALMLLSPVAPLLAGYAGIALWEHRRRVEGGLLLALLVIGIVWTDGLTYHSASPAPKDRLTELKHIDERYTGQGPAGYLEFEELAKYILRDVPGTGVAETFGHPSHIGRESSELRGGYSYEPDELIPQALLDNFKLLVMRQGPLISRPPTGWTRVFHGDWYDVWRRDPGAQAPLAHLPLGGRFDASADAPCPDVRRLAKIARAAGGHLVWAPRPQSLTFRVAKAPRPAGWTELPGDPEILVEDGQGRLAGTIDAPADGDYTVWLQGQVYRSATLSVDGRSVGTVKNEFAQRPAELHVGAVHLTAGLHAVAVNVGGGSLAPGNGGINRTIGPVSFEPDADLGDDGLRTVDAADWRSVCGQHADWVEAVR